MARTATSRDTGAAITREKLTEVVGVPLSEEQRTRLQNFIEKHCPEASEGKVLRIAYLYLETVVERQGPLHIIGNLMGA